MTKRLISCAVAAVFIGGGSASDAQTPALSSLDRQLIAAAEKESLARVEALLRAGARPNSIDREQTALSVAAWRAVVSHANPLKVVHAFSRERSALFSDSFDSHD